MRPVADSRGTLEPLVSDRLTIREMALRLDRSESTIRHWLKHHCMDVPRGRKRELIQEAIRTGSRTIVSQCKRHGQTEFALVGSDHHPRCKKCRSEAVARRRRKVKKILVNEHGGNAGCADSTAMCPRSNSIISTHPKRHRPRQAGHDPIHRAGVERRRARGPTLANCHAMVEAGALELGDRR